MNEWSTEPWIFGSAEPNCNQNHQTITESRRTFQFAQTKHQIVRSTTMMNEDMQIAQKFRLTR